MSRSDGRTPRRAHALIVLAVLGTGTAHAQIPRGAAAAPSTQPAPQVAAASQKAAMKEFDERLKAYLDLRRDITKKLSPIASTSDAAQLDGRQKALAAAIQDARRHAKRGDLIPTEVATQIKQVVIADLQAREPTARTATLEEVPIVALKLNQSYPANAALTTIPPLLLARLPGLPDSLQYRFVGRHVAILDGDVHIVLDYVENVLPRR